MVVAVSSVISGIISKSFKLASNLASPVLTSIGDWLLPAHSGLVSAQWSGPIIRVEKMGWFRYMEIICCQLFDNVTKHVVSVQWSGPVGVGRDWVISMYVTGYACKNLFK